MSEPRRTMVEYDRRPIGRVFSLLATAAIASYVVRELLLGHDPLWIAVAAIAGGVLWVVASLLPVRMERTYLVLIFAGIVVGSLVACATEIVGFLPAIGGVSTLISRPSRSIRLGVAGALLAFLLVGVGALFVPASWGEVVGALAALVVLVLISLSRRQYRAGERQERLLLEERLAVEQERAENAALAERSRIARDIHDVLAHSLGGLVLQLDAVEALLESGRADEAYARVAAARGLAAEGLEEARRAVDALRDPEVAADPAAAIEQLVETHRALGARAELHETGDRGPLDAAAAGALRRAAQEVLSNARRHAPGMPTELSLEWSPTDVAFRASTALAAGGGSSSAGVAGGGRGLTGLRERMVALGGTATAGVQGKAFVVEARVPLGSGPARERVDA